MKKVLKSCLSYIFKGSDFWVSGFCFKRLSKRWVFFFHFLLLFSCITQRTLSKSKTTVICECQPSPPPPPTHGVEGDQRTLDRQQDYIGNKLPSTKQILHLHVATVWRKLYMPNWKTPKKLDVRKKTSICGKEYSLFTVFFSYYIHGRTDQVRIKET